MGIYECIEKVKVGVRCRSPPDYIL